MLFAAAYFLRRRTESPGTRARIAGLVAAALLGGGGFLGGQIVYRGGAGVDPAVLAPELRSGHGGGGHPMPMPPSPGQPAGGDQPAPGGHPEHGR